MKIHNEEDGTPECLLCGQDNIGLAEEAVIMLRGQWLPSQEYDVPIFLLDPDTKLSVIQLPNGQLALMTDIQGHPSKHSHKECLEQLAQEFLDPDEDYEDCEADEPYEVDDDLLMRSY